MTPQDGPRSICPPGGGVGGAGGTGTPTGASGPSPLRFCVVYARASTSDQQKGISAQLTACRAWAEREGLEVRAEWADLGVSGGAGLDDRPALADALVALKRGDTLVAQRRDRFARSVAVAVALEAEVRRQGCAIAAVQGGGNGDSPEAVLMRQMLDAFAQFERSLIRARTAAVARLMKSRGSAYGRAPFGWVAVGSPGARRLLRDRGAWSMRADILEARAAGLPYQRIGDELDLHPEKVRRICRFKPSPAMLGAEFAG